MKECPRCKKKLPDEASFCFVCGALEEEKSSPQIIRPSLSPKPPRTKIQPSFEEYRAENLKATNDQKAKKLDTDKTTAIPKPPSKEPTSSGVLLQSKLKEKETSKKWIIETGKAIKKFLSPVGEIIRKNWERSKIKTVGSLIGICLLVVLFGYDFFISVKFTKNFKSRPSESKKIPMVQPSVPSAKKLILPPKKIESAIKASETISSNEKQKQPEIDKKSSLIKPNSAEKTARTDNIKRILKLANNYLNTGQYKEAIKNFNEVLKLDPNNSQAKMSIRRATEIVLKLANNYLNTGQYKEAIKNFNEVLKLDPNNSQAKMSIKRATEISEDMKVVQVFLDHGRYDDAIYLLERLRGKNPGNEAIVTAIEKIKRAKRAEEEILGD